MRNVIVVEVKAGKYCRDDIFRICLFYSMDEEELKDKYDKNISLNIKSTFYLIMELIEILKAPVIVEINPKSHLIYLEKQSMITMLNVNRFS